MQPRHQNHYVTQNNTREQGTFIGFYHAQKYKRKESRTWKQKSYKTTKYNQRYGHLKHKTHKKAVTHHKYKPSQHNHTKNTTARSHTTRHNVGLRKQPTTEDKDIIQRTSRKYRKNTTQIQQKLKQNYKKIYKSSHQQTQREPPRERRVHTGIPTEGPPRRCLPTTSAGRHRQSGAGCGQRSSDGPAPQSDPSTEEQRPHPAPAGTHHGPRRSGRADQADPQRRRRTHRLSSSPQGRSEFFHG